MTDERSYDTNDDPRIRDRRRESEMASEPVTHSETPAERTRRETPAERMRTDPGAQPVQAGTTYGTPDRERGRHEPVELHRTSRTMDLWPEMGDYQRRFDDIQSQFIEDPREAVKNAEHLVEDAIERMSTTMRERVQGMHRDADSGDTEKLRVEMKALRDFITSLGGRRAA